VTDTVAEVLAAALDTGGGDAEDLTWMVGCCELEDFLGDGLWFFEGDDFRPLRGAGDDAENDAPARGPRREAGAEVMGTRGGLIRLVSSWGS
jgi:hypothetical protein